LEGMGGIISTGYNPNSASCRDKNDEYRRLVV
jgi:hypothetical protein